MRRKRAVSWAIALCVALSVPMLVQTSFATELEAEPEEYTIVLCDRQLAWARIQNTGPVEIPQPLTTPRTEARTEARNDAKRGGPTLSAGISTRGGGMTRAQKAEVEIRSLIRKLD